MSDLFENLFVLVFFVHDKAHMLVGGSVNWFDGTFISPHGFVRKIYSFNQAFHYILATFVLFIVLFYNGASFNQNFPKKLKISNQ